MSGWYMGDFIGFDIGFLSVSQTTYGSPTCKVLIQFQITGVKAVQDMEGHWTEIDNVQVYAINAANGGPNGLGDLVDTVDMTITDYQYASVVDLQAGAVYTLALCPRSVTNGTLDDQIADIYWETVCVFESFTTQVDLPQTGKPRPPVITNLQFKPATVKDDASIKVTWEADATANYQCFQIRWNEGGHSREQGEVDYDHYPITTGEWTATPVFPRERYSFAVNGGVSGGFQCNYYDWGPVANITAPSNLTSLRQFLSTSGINPVGADIRQLVSPLTSLSRFMKLTY